MPCTVDHPPVLSGSSESQLQQVYGFLSMMTEQLNNALTHIDSSSFATPDMQRTMSRLISGEASEEERQELYRERERLKGIIKANATAIQERMETIAQAFGYSYEAESPYGSFSEAVENTIIQGATGITQNFVRQEQLDSYVDGQVSFEEFVRSQVAAIRIGELYEDAGGMHYGVGIINTVTTDGNADEASKVFLTENQLQFFQGDMMLAWFGADSLYINRARIVQSIHFGDLVADV